jgi:hypothetical protein
MYTDGEARRGERREARPAAKPRVGEARTTAKPRAGEWRTAAKQRDDEVRRERQRERHERF